jgi:hypothetical protein
MESAEKYLEEKNIPNRTISGRKPTGQFPEYKSSLSELLEDYHQTKLKSMFIARIKSSKTMTAVEFNNRFEYKLTILRENSEECEMHVKEYHYHSKENEPTYLRWLLGDHIGDYGSEMTEEDKELLEEFESML